MKRILAVILVLGIALCGLMGCDKYNASYKQVSEEEQSAVLEVLRNAQIDNKSCRYTLNIDGELRYCEWYSDKIEMLEISKIEASGTVRFDNDSESSNQKIYVYQSVERLISEAKTEKVVEAEMWTRDSNVYLDVQVGRVGKYGKGKHLVPFKSSVEEIFDLYIIDEEELASLADLEEFTLYKSGNKYKVTARMSIASLDMQNIEVTVYILLDGDGNISSLKEVLNCDSTYEKDGITYEARLTGELVMDFGTYTVNGPANVEEFTAE